MRTDPWTSVVRAPLAALFAAAAPALPIAADVPPTDAELRAELDTLRAEVDALRSTMSGEAPLDAARAAEVRAIVEDVLADADARASLQSSGATAGWDKGFFLASPDGNFRLNIKGYTQFRWVMNHVRDPGLDRWSEGFENARTQLFFEGHLIDKSFTYRVQSNFSRSGGSLTLFDAWIAKSFDNGLKLVAGQFRDPMLREFLVVETTQLLVERSLVHQAFTFDRTQGVMLEYQNDLLRLQGSFNDGAQTANTAWQAPTTEYAFAARGELRFGGDWAQFNDFTSFPGEALAGLVGAAIGWQNAEDGSVSLAGEVVQWTVDGAIEFGGANLFAAVVGRHSTDLPGGNLDQYGAVGQGGFFVLPEVELYGRYEWGDADDGGEDLSVATAGANWYISKQRLKISGDFGYGFNAVTAFFGQPSSIAGWRTDTAGDDGQWVIRMQAQIMF